MRVWKNGATWWESAREVANKMDVCRQACPVAVPPQHYGTPAGKMKSFSGVPGTLGGIALRLGQLTFAFIAFVTMIKVPGYHSITAFRYEPIISNPPKQGWHWLICKKKDL